MPYITAGECASRLRYTTWDLIKTNLSPRDRLYDYDDYWVNLKRECANQLLPFLDEQIYDLTGIDLNQEPFQFNSENQLIKELEQKEAELQSVEMQVKQIQDYQKTKMPPPDYLKLGLFLVVSTGMSYFLTKRLL